MRGPSPGGLRAKAIADAAGLELLTSYRPDPRLPALLERDRLRVPARSPLGRACEAIVVRAARHTPVHP